MTYDEAEHFIFSQLPFFERDGDRAIKVGLRNITLLCERMGNPQNGFKSVHVAGTNGKGSTSHFLASIFQEAGYKTGLYTSPHLKDYRERFKINGQLIPKSIVQNFVSDFKKDILAINPTFFELTVALSFYWFASEQVDIAIIEVGLGGRLDATNIITPVLSVITSIGFDHQRQLGNTLQEIAFEKAGIIKQNIPVVIGEERAETLGVFKQIATERTASLYLSSKITVTNVQFGLALTLDALVDNSILTVKSPLAGIYQAENLKTVLQSCAVLREDFSLSESSIKDGIMNVLKNTDLKGRWQLLNENPFTICDTGHNEAAWIRINEQLSTLAFNHYHFILGFSKDKDVLSILKNLPQPNSIYFCKFDSPRSLSFDKFCLLGADSAGNYENVNHAINFVTGIAKRDEMIFVGGSTYLVAEINNI